MPHRGQGLYQFCYRQDRFSFQRKIAMNKESEYEFIAYPKLNHVKVGFVDIDFRRPHIHREMEIGLVLSGNANLIVNGQRYSIQQGSIFFINANEMHNVACQGQGSVRIVYIQVSNRFCQEYLHLFRNLEILQSDLTENITARDNCVLTRLIIETCRYYLDDSELSLEIAKGLIKQSGAIAEVAHNGGEALFKFTTSGVGSYDLILMDITMPDLDGCEVTREIRKMPRPDAKVPIIALTSLRDEKEHKRALESGMNEVVMKPLDIKELMGVINGIYN